MQLVANSDSLDHQYLVLDDDVAFSVAREPTSARLDPARLQRAPEGARESTRGGGDDIIERSSVLWILSRRRPVVLPNFTMCAEHDRIRLSREARLTYRPAIPHDANPRHVREPLDHIQQLWCALTRWRARVRRAQGGTSRPRGRLR
jgi:hypothetical protein